VADIKPKYFTEQEIIDLLSEVTDEELQNCHKHELVPSKDVILYQGIPGEARVKDSKGKEYIDFTSQAWTLGIGYIQQDVMFAAMEQMKRLSHARNQFQTIPRYKACQQTFTNCTRQPEKRGVKHSRRLCGS